MEILDIVLLLIGAGVIPFAFNLLRGQFGKIKNEQVKEAVWELTEATEDAVEAAMNTTVKQLRKKGEWNEETAKEVKEAVKASAINSVSSATRKAIAKNFGDDVIGEKVGNVIERTVTRIKERRANKLISPRKPSTSKTSTSKTAKKTS